MSELIFVAFTLVIGPLLCAAFLFVAGTFEDRTRRNNAKHIAEFFRLNKSE